MYDTALPSVSSMLRTACLVFAFAVVVTEDLVAQNVFWGTSSDGFYTDVSNWLPMAVPTAANNLVFQFPGDYRVDMLDNRSANQIEVLDNAGVTFDLHNAAAGVGAVLAITTDVKVADSELSIGDGLGTKRQVLDVDGDIDVTGFANDSTRGTLTVNDDGTLLSGNAVLGNGSGRFGWARVTGTRANWDMPNGTLSIGSTNGNGGGGQLIVENGAVYSAASIQAGLSPISPDQSDRGELIISGVGNDGLPSSVNLTGPINIASRDDSRAELTMDSGAKLITDDVTVGSLFGGIGTIEISGTDTLGNPTTWDSSDFFVNRTNSTNGIRFLDGAQINTSGEAGIALGEITLSGVAAVGGTPTNWTIAGDLQIGLSSSDIDVEEGAQLEAASLSLAVGASSIGSLRLRDSTPGKLSRLTIVGDALIGGTETTSGGVANLEIGQNTKAHIGGLLKIWDNAFVPLEGELYASEIDIQDGLSTSLPLMSGKLSFDTFHGDLVVENVTVSPGETTSSATVFGQLEFDSTATLQLDLNGPLAGAGFDQLTVSGNALLDGTLELTLGEGFAPDASDTFVVLGSPFLTGSFDNIANGGRLTTIDGRGSFIVNYGLSSPFNANQIVLSEFVPELTADYNNDGTVNIADYTAWRDALGQTGLVPYESADGNGDGEVTVADYDLWRGQFGMSMTTPSPLGKIAVPEPSTIVLISVLIASQAWGFCNARHDV